MQLSTPFTHLSDYALTNRLKREFITDKKTGCVYYVVCRYKNCHRGAPRRGEQNTETLVLEIDPNLSPNFIIEEVDLVSGRSITCNLTKLDQSSIGRTLLTMSVFYIDEAQSLQESVRTFYMDSIGGTITKRLDLSLETFRMEAKAIIDEINGKGFSNKRIEKASYYASYFILRGKSLDSRRDKWAPKNIYNTWGNHDSGSLNTMLYLYSMLKGNFLDTGGKFMYITDHFIDVRRYNWHPTKHLYTEQEMAELDAVMEYYRLNRAYLKNLVNECSKNSYFDQDKFKANVKISFCEEVAQ